MDEREPLSGHGVKPRAVQRGAVCSARSRWRFLGECVRGMVHERTDASVVAQIRKREDPQVPRLCRRPSPQTHQRVEALAIGHGQVVHAEARQHSATPDAVVRGVQDDLDVGRVRCQEAVEPAGFLALVRPPTGVNVFAGPVVFYLAVMPNSRAM